MVANIVNMQMYIQHGKPFPPKLKIKGLANTESLLGYKDYTARNSSRSDNDSQIEMDANGYFGYTSRDGSRNQSGEELVIRTYTNEGWIENEEHRTQFKNEIAKCFQKDGDLCWMPIQSFKDYITAEQYGLFTEDDYAAVISKTLPKFLKQCGFDPENILWWMDYHTNKNHPHTHLVFTEKLKSRTNPILPMKALNDFKKYMVLEAINRQNMIKGVDVKTIFKEKDLLNKQLKESINLKKLYKYEGDIEYSIKQLLKKIDHADGKRLQYNSLHMKEYTEEIDKIIDLVLEHPSIHLNYEMFIKECQRLDDLSTAELNTIYSNIQDSESARIKSYIGNQILKLKKEDLITLKMENKLDELVDIETKSEYIYTKSINDAEKMISIRERITSGDFTAVNDLKVLSEQMNPYAMAKMGVYLVKGKFVDQNIELGLSLLKKSSEIGENSNLGFSKFFEKTYKSFYENNQLRDSSKFNEEIDENDLYIKNIKDARIMQDINIKLRKNDLTAINDLKKQVEKNNPYAMAKYGGFLVKGRFVEKDVQLGLLYIKKASILGNKSALDFMEYHENYEFNKRLRKSKTNARNVPFAHQRQEGDFMFESNKFLKRILHGSNSAISNGFRNVERKTKQMIEEYLEDNENEINH